MSGGLDVRGGFETGTGFKGGSGVDAGSGHDDLRPVRGRLPMAFVIILTLVVVGFAATVAVWMYWLAGTVIG